MAGTPTLGEITSIARDPGTGTETPRARIDLSDMVHNLNQAAQFKAENDWRKYNSMLGNLKEVYQNIGEIEGQPVMDKDRPYLQKQAAEVFESLTENPNKSIALLEVNKKLGKLKSEAAQSVQDRVYDFAHRQFVERDPTLNTDENKSMIEGYANAPLGERKQYILKLPSLYNPQAIAEQINDVIPQKFATTGLSPDGKFVNTTEGIRYDEKQFKTLADQMYISQDPKTGRSLASEAADRLKSLPKEFQDHYAEKYPDDPVKGFYDETVMPWRKPDQITSVKPITNQFELERYKNEDKLKQMEVKFGYDKVIEDMKIGGAKAVARLREKIRLETQLGKVGALKGLVDKMVVDAKSGKPIPAADGTFYKLPVSGDLLKSYSRKEGVLKKEVSPDDMLISEDGTKVKQVYYKKAGDPNSGIDEKKSRTFSRDEFTARFGKDVLGVSATEKELNADDDNADTGETPSSKPKLY